MGVFNNNFEINSTVDKETGRITIQTKIHGERHVTVSIVEAESKHVKEALVNLGWTPPGTIPTHKEPNISVSSYYFEINRLREENARLKEEHEDLKKENHRLKHTIECFEVTINSSKKEK